MNKRRLYITLGVVAVLIAAVCVFGFIYPTHYPYNDRFVLGSTRDEIVARYGDFWLEELNSQGELRCGQYMIQDNTPELIMGLDNSLWYEVYFTDGIATEVRLRRGYIGG